MQTIEGKLLATDHRYCLIASRFNSHIVSSLIEGAVDALVRHGAQSSDIDLVKVPGAVELPLAARRIAEGRRYDAIVALGAVIRGATPHFDYVCAQASQGLAQVSLDSGIPVGFGLLTVDTIEQAIERAGTKAGNKGEEAALAAVEMVNLLREIGP